MLLKRVGFVGSVIVSTINNFFDAAPARSIKRTNLRDAGFESATCRRGDRSFAVKGASG